MLHGGQDQAGCTTLSKSIISYGSSIKSNVSDEYVTKNQTTAQCTLADVAAAAGLLCGHCTTGQAVGHQGCTPTQRQPRQSMHWSFTPANSTQRAHNLQLTHGAVQLRAKPLPPPPPHTTVQSCRRLAQIRCRPAPASSMALRADTPGMRPHTVQGFKSPNKQAAALTTALLAATRPSTNPTPLPPKSPTTTLARRIQGP